jgi:hypothetical protein
MSKPKFEYIDSDDLMEMIYDELLMRGYAPTEEEAEDLADIFFNVLLSIGLEDEIDLDDLEEMLGEEPE